jgi:hypothetical protein
VAITGAFQTSISTALPKSVSESKFCERWYRTTERVGASCWPNGEIATWTNDMVETICQIWVEKRETLMRHRAKFWPRAPPELVSIVPPVLIVEPFTLNTHKRVWFPSYQVLPTLHPTETTPPPIESTTGRSSATSLVTQFGLPVDRIPAADKPDYLNTIAINIILQEVDSLTPPVDAIMAEFEAKRQTSRFLLLKTNIESKEFSKLPVGRFHPR